MDSIVTQKNIASYIDHTNVKADASEGDIKKLCFEAKKYGFHSVCITPFRVKDARKYLGLDTKIELICVIGFPFGVTTTLEKILEAKTAKSDGATEIDMIINIGAIKDGNWKYVKNEIAQIAKGIQPLGLKVIMEIGFLTKNELIKACRVAKEAGARFVKTSTGWGPRVPRPDDIRLMRQVVGKDFGVKASGGIHNTKTTQAMIQAGANRIGTSSSLEIIGAKKPKEKKEKE